MPNPALRALPDPIPITDEVQGLLDTINGLERANRKLHREVKALERDKQKEAEESKHWPMAV